MAQESQQIPPSQWLHVPERNAEKLFMAPNQSLLTTAAIPMVGFGFMDNL
jgi:hypothetical protein